MAGAQSGTVKFILPNATGSGVDAITRAAQTALGKALNATVVVDNQPGAGGVVGLQALARSAPDGNTLSVVSNNVVIFPSVLKSLPFDMPGDFTPIAVVGATPMVLVVNPQKMPAANARDFFALRFAPLAARVLLHTPCTQRNVVKAPDAVRRLQKVKGVRTVTFTQSDIVRSGLTARIVAAYENA